MTRKGKKAPGGHNPLTYHERSKLTAYGTQTIRLSTESQRRFGDCCLGLQPILHDAVATPSGHLYSREAILSYLLTKTKSLKQAKTEYDKILQQKIQKEESNQQLLQLESLERFEHKNQGAIQNSTQLHSQSLKTQERRNIKTESIEKGRSSLKRTSYWLSEHQPEYDPKSDMLKQGPPPERPNSPMSGNPLRRKDLITLKLNTESTSSSSNDIRFTCAVSGKMITTQPVIAIKKTGQVMLKSVFEELAKPTMICPVTGKKFKDKDVLILQKAASGFAASGKVQAKKYRPTLT